MADPLSIAGSVVGVISLGIQATQYLVNYYTAVRDQQDDILRTLNSLESLLDVLQDLRNQAENRKFGAKEINLLSNFSSSITQCEECIVELQKEVEKYKKDPANPLRYNTLVKSPRIAGLIQRVTRIILHASRRATYPFQVDTLEKLDNNISGILLRLSMFQKALLQRDLDTTKAILDLVRANQISSKIRNWLNAPDATVNFNEACNKRHSDTGLWFVEGAAFSSWLEEPNSFLWLNGFAGTGKSVLCSTAIQYAFQHRKPSPRIGIAFFFFTFSDISKQDTSAMLRALLLQLSSQLQSHTIVEQLHDNYRVGIPPNQDLEDSLHQTIRAFDQVYIILDALDESPRNKHREDVLRSVVNLHSWSEPSLHLLVTSRDEVDIRDEINDHADETISMKNSVVNDDIGSFIKQRLQMNRLNKWKKFHDRIQSVLTGRAKGNFRWVECQLQSLAACPPSEDLFNRLLNSLPESLDETYQRMLINIEPEVKDYAQRMLTLLCCAKRPLTALELLDGMAIDFGDKPSFDPKRKLDDVKWIQEVCPGFVEMSIYHNTYDETYTGVHSGETIVHIAHFSVQEYLESDRIRQNEQVKLFAVYPIQAHTQIASACLMFLVEPTFVASPDNYPIVHYAAACWPYHFRQGVETPNIEGQILRLFRNKDNAFDNWSESFSIKMELRPPRSPLPYASGLGLLSTVRELLKETKSNGGRPYDATLRAPFGIALSTAATLGHKEVTQLFFNKKGDIDISDEEWFFSFHQAAAYGQEEIVQLFIDQGIDVNGSHDHFRTALHAAAREGHERIVQLLLRNNADINKPNDSCWHDTAEWIVTEGHHKVFRILLENNADFEVRGDILRAAAVRGQEVIVRLLLDRGLDVDSRDNVNRHSVNARSHPKTESCTTVDGIKIDKIRYGLGQTVLSGASAGGHEGIVRLLIDRNAEINAQDAHGRTPLFEASENGHEQTVRLLLSKNAEINTQDFHGRTPLFEASKNGHEQTVRLLLSSNANVNIRDADGKTALFGACWEGHDQVVQLLLMSNAEINAQDADGTTPLWVASGAGKIGVVQLLIDRGADINRKDHRGLTPLLIAVQGDNMEIVRLLLIYNSDIDRTALLAIANLGIKGCRPGPVQLLVDNGADVNIQDDTGKTPLFLAAEVDSWFARRLLDCNADCDIRDIYGRTAIWIASFKGHRNMVRLLLERNADASIKSTFPGHEGLNAFTVAQKYGHKKVIQIYLDNGLGGLGQGVSTVLGML